MECGWTFQVRMIRVLLEHGADRTAKVEGEFTPYDLVKSERALTRGLLALDTAAAGVACSRPAANTSPVHGRSRHICH